jgi:hypothetical protein
MTLAVNDTNHRSWRDLIEGLVDEWRTVGDDGVLDLTVEQRDTRTAKK